MNKHAQELAKLGRGKKKTLSTHERRRRRLWAKNLHVYREKKKKCSNVNKRKGKMMRVDKQKGFMNETPPTFDIESLLGQAPLHVISLWQPWATWILWGWKTIETRRHVRFRNLVTERIGIHAAKHFDKDWRLHAGRYLNSDRIQKTEGYSHSAGVLLCTALVVDHCRVRHYNSPEALIECETPRYGLFLDRIEAIKPPIPMRGRQGIWTYRLTPKRSSTPVDTM